MKQLQFSRYEFKPSIAGTLALIICVPLFLRLGYWQYNKAAQRQAIQLQFEQSSQGGATPLPDVLSPDVDFWAYKKVQIRGQYVPKYQIWLDNQVHGAQAGFDVITPLKIEGQNRYVMVNRGWVAGSDNHQVVPKVETPENLMTIVGQVWVPSKKIFTLAAGGESASWHTVWQNMDMAKYQQITGLDVMPIVIRLDAKSDAGGFLRDWQLPANKIATNMGYALQWLGFAVASILIYGYTSFKRKLG